MMINVFSSHLSTVSCARNLNIFIQFDKKKRIRAVVIFLNDKNLKECHESIDNIFEKHTCLYAIYYNSLICYFKKSICFFLKFLLVFKKNDRIVIIVILKKN